MRRKLCVLALCACGLAAASSAEQNEKYIYMTLGMTRDAFQAVKPEAKQYDTIVGSRNTNAVVLTELKGESSIAVLYHFVDDRLRAVTLGQLHFGKRDEQTVKRVHDTLTKDLIKKADENVIRLDEHVQPIRANAELWTYEKSGACIYFVDTSNEIVIIAFDPKYFGKKDFFVSPDEMPKNAPALEEAKGRPSK